MTKLHQLDSTNNTVDSHSAVPQLLAALLVMLSIAVLSNAAAAQGLSLNLTDDLVPAVAPASRTVKTLVSEFGAYDQRQLESLDDLGRLRQSEGEFLQALRLFKQALHVVRINKGLYHESQISIIDDIISAEIALQNWEEVNNFYAYQDHLYRRLYSIDDPRLEAGLRKVSAWHVTALNVNLDGKRIEHLREANKLYKLRMKVAQNTLSHDDPKLTMLARNIEIFERELFLSSDLNREMVVRQKKDSQTRRSSFRQNEDRLVVSRN